MRSLRRSTLLICICAVFVMLTFFQSSNIPINLNLTKSLLHFNDDYTEIPPYIRHPSTETIACESFFANFTEHPHPKVTKRVKTSDSDKVNVSCDAIQTRGYYPDQSVHDDYPIAFARIVYMDYQFQEIAFRADFAPKNVFCYTIDKKAKPNFVDKMLALAECFPDNIIILKERFDVQQNGRNMIGAHLACLDALAQKKWNYVFLLQNSDMKSKTNAETVEILKILNGANDVSALKPSKRHIRPADYTIKGLGIFRNSTLNDRKPTKEKAVKLQITKSFVQSILSRAAIDYLHSDLNVTKFINKLESNSYGFDEGFFGTLNNNDLLNLPGGYTHRCLDQGIEFESFTRLSLWENIQKMNALCRSRKFRHTMCIFGLEDMFYLESQPHTIVNKFMPSFDFGAIDCFAERLHNRTYYGVSSNADLTAYEEQPHVLYNDLKQKGKASQFKCFKTIVTTKS